MRSPERSAMASNPERGEILLTELQVRAAARAGGSGRGEREKVARGRGPREAVRPPRPYPAKCGNLGMSLGSRFLRELDPLPPPEPWPATALITYQRDPHLCLQPDSALSLSPERPAHRPLPGCQSRRRTPLLPPLSDWPGPAPPSLVPCSSNSFE